MRRTTTAATVAATAALAAALTYGTAFAHQAATDSTDSGAPAVNNAEFLVV